MFGRHGLGVGELDLPVDIAVGGMVYVRDCRHNHVSVFTSDGQCVASFGGGTRRIQVSSGDSGR